MPKRGWRTFREYNAGMRASLSFLLFTTAAIAQNHEPPQPGGPIAAADRDYVVAYLEKTRREFLASVEGLRQDQWIYKPSTGGWSIAECAEHITLAEDALFGVVNNMLKNSPEGGGAPRTREMDEKIIAFMTDRSKKAQAPEILKPTGKFATPAAAIAQYNQRRDRSLQFARTTKEDLRGRVQPSQLFGTIDAYQYLLFMAAHSSRHTAQLNEVKTDPQYPK